MNIFRLTSLAYSHLRIFIRWTTHCQSLTSDFWFWSWPFLAVTALARSQGGVSRLHLSMTNSSYRCSPDSFGTFRISTFTWICLLSYKFYRRKWTTTNHNCTALARYSYSIKKSLASVLTRRTKKYVSNTHYFTAIFQSGDFPKEA